MARLQMISALALASLIPTASTADWNGYYAGVSFGTVTNLSYDVTTDIDPDVDFEDSEGFGVFFGSRAQSSGFVYGGELAVEFTPEAENTDGEVFVDFVVDLKATAGVPAGDVLLYGILTLSSISGEYGPNDISATGFGAGVGAAFIMGDTFEIGAEYITRSGSQEFDLTDLDATADTLKIRAAFHF